MARDTKELEVINKAYDLVVWASRHIAKFPRNHKFTLGDRMSNGLQELLQLLLQAKYTRQRRPLLERANTQLEILRFQFRMAKDLECWNIDRLGTGSRSINEVGRLVGGWLKSA
ncbi:MAG: diversity-generating retroelement protein Avd [Planctomycetota bacterium]|nr:diversity-generating retroelement protein Avd [Planctomycetota bacterium]